MANTAISNSAATSACDSIVDLLDEGSGAGTLKIYDGSQPSGPDEEVDDQNLLSEHDLSDPAFGDATDADPGGQATANSISDDTSANADGTASWFRASDGDGTAVIDGDVSEEDGDGDLELNSVDITEGSNVSITDWTVTMPEG